MNHKTATQSQQREVIIRHLWQPGLKCRIFFNPLGYSLERNVKSSCPQNHPGSFSLPSPLHMQKKPLCFPSSSHSLNTCLAPKSLGWPGPLLETGQLKPALWQQLLSHLPIILSIPLMLQAHCISHFLPEDLYLLGILYI